MTVRWRLALLAVQLAILLTASVIVTGQPVTGETWFLAGLLAVIINPQLLEPWYSRPADVLGNAIVAGFLIMTAPRGAAADGWYLLGAFIAIAAVVALLALVLGAGRAEGESAAIGRSAATLSRIASATVIYSGVFWLSALDFHPSLGRDLWVLGGAWAIIVLLARVNWQAIWSAATGRPMPCAPQGMIGPSTLIVTSDSLPPPGTSVLLRWSSEEPVVGVVLSRIRRSTDVWGQIHISDAALCEDLVRRAGITLEVSRKDSDEEFAGAVDAGSTDRTLRFVTTKPLAVGTVVSVKHDDVDVLYQVVSAQVEDVTVRGGSHLVVRARAEQVGRYDAASQHISRHPWVPEPGRAVTVASRAPVTAGVELADATRFHLGDVLGTHIPVFLDLTRVCEGHLALLGMTRMGKTTLALRLARSLSQTRRVIILDQTGQYTGPEGLAAYAAGDEDLPNGVSVYEPALGAVPADDAYAFVTRLAKKAQAEYLAGQVHQRVVIIDEAHQFIPEPAGLGFNAPGRESALQFGILMMQIRKFGISVVLISQRTAVVSKSALSQCETLIAFKSVDQTGLDYLEAVLGDAARQALPVLQQGQACAFGPAISSDTPAIVQVRNT